MNCPRSSSEPSIAPQKTNKQKASDYLSSEQIQKLKKELYTIISNHSGQEYQKVHDDSDRDYWMRAEEAKEYGMIDEVLIRK